MKYFKNTSWLFSEKILRMVVGLFVTVWVARYLGPEQFGVFSYAISFVGLFAVISTLGLDGIIVRELVKDESRRDAILGTAFILKLTGALGVFLFLAAAVNFTSNDLYTNTLVFIIAAATVLQSFNVIDYYFQSKILSKYVVFSNIISLSVTSVIKIVLILYEAPLVAFAWVVVFDAFVLACGLVYFFNNNHLLIKSWRFNKAVAIDLLKDSWPFILSGIAISIYLKMDQIMIKEMIGSEAVGQYAVAVTLSEVWYFVPMIISSSLLPAIINSKKINEGLYRSRLQRLYDLMVVLSILIAFITTFLGNWVVEVLYGEQYNQSASVLIIHIWAGVFVFLGVASGKWLLIENIPIFSAINTAIGAIMNVFLNYFLINEIGIKGAALATVISYAFSGYILLALFDKTRGNFFNMTKSLFFIHMYRRCKKNGI